MKETAYLNTPDGKSCELDTSEYADLQDFGRAMQRWMARDPATLVTLPQKPSGSIVLTVGLLRESYLEIR